MSGFEEIPQKQSFSIETGYEAKEGEGILAVVKVVGELDLFTAPDFKAAITAEIDTVDASNRGVAVDFSKCTYIDSASLGMLIGAHRRLQRSERLFIIRNPNDGVAKSLKITGLDSVFTIEQTDSEEDAPSELAE